MINLIKKLFEDERVRFVFVGGINTVLGYATFALFTYMYQHGMGVSPKFAYMPGLITSQVVMNYIGFMLQRNITFRSKGSFWKDFARFTVVNATSYGANLVLLPFAVHVLKMNPMIAQLIILVISVVISYVGHKFYSFKDKDGVKPKAK